LSINLYTSSYTTSNPQRNLELEFCYNQNKANSHINNIFLIASQTKITFSKLFEKVNETSGEDDINIIANSDIYFNNSIAHSLNMHKDHVYALSRWNNNKRGLIRAKAVGSADAWIFRGKKSIYSDFYTGYWGCDGRLGYEIIKAGNKLYNPSLTIKAIHLHQSNIRGDKKCPFQGRTEVVVGPYAGALASTIEKLVPGKIITSPLPKHYILPKGNK